MQFHYAENISLGELSELVRQGAAGDVIGCFIDAGRNELKWPGAGCHIGLTLDQLKAIPVSVALAGGTSKIAGIQAVLRARLANTLITDKCTAELILQDST